MPGTWAAPVSPWSNDRAQCAECGQFKSKVGHEKVQNRLIPHYAPAEVSS